MITAVWIFQSFHLNLISTLVTQLALALGPNYSLRKLIRVTVTWGVTAFLP
jgi:hypothetical protein